MSALPLLKWGIENSDADELRRTAGESQEKLSKLDPRIIEMILGKDEAVLIREAVEVCTDGSEGKFTEDERMIAFERLQDLVEQIDNANNVAKMHLWEKILPALNDPSLSIQCSALKIISTCVRNNPEASESILKVEPKLLINIFRILQKGLKNQSVGLLKRAVSVLSAFCPSLKKGDDLDEFITGSGLSVFEQIHHDLLSADNGDEEAANGFSLSVASMLNNYCASQETIPKKLINNELLYPKFLEFHREYCDDPECSFFNSIPHQTLN